MRAFQTDFCLESYWSLVKALESFRAFENEEYTFEQEELHRAFLTLFEKLIANFLLKEGITPLRFYAIVKRFMETKSSSSILQGNSDASEVVDVISFYTTFETWACAMKDQAMMRFGRPQTQIKYSFEHRLNEAIEQAQKRISCAGAK